MGRWFAEYERFWKVFPRVNEGVKIVTSLPGNHDIGLGDGIQPERLNRFRSHFANISSSSSSSSTSQSVDVCNFDLVLLDTPSLLNKISPAVFEPSSTFLDHISDSPPPFGRLLFSHIPLYRPSDTDCGPYRESSTPIRVGSGYQYQNTLDVDLTIRILDSMWPVEAVFSGDDHDYCVVKHKLEGRHEEIPEYTLKSFSWAMVLLPLLSTLRLMI